MLLFVLLEEMLLYYQMMEPTQAPNRYSQCNLLITYSVIITLTFPFERADYLNFRLQRTCDRKTIGSHLKNDLVHALCYLI